MCMASGAATTTIDAAAQAGSTCANTWTTAAYTPTIGTRNDASTTPARAAAANPDVSPAAKKIHDRQMMLSSADFQLNRSARYVHGCAAISPLASRIVMR